MAGVRMPSGAWLPHAQATALGPLRARAVDASAPLSMLQDHHARALAHRLGLSLRGLPLRRTRAIAMRSLVIDGWVRSVLVRHRGATIVEVGAGLSTRFERLDNGVQRWFDCDLAAMVALRRALFPASERREHVVAPAESTAWHDRVVSPSTPYCFVFEAVIAYLQPGELREILTRITRRFEDVTIILDLPRTWPDALGFGAMDGWVPGLRVAETSSFFGCSARDGRSCRPSYRVARFATS